MHLNVRHCAVMPTAKHIIKNVPLAVLNVKVALAVVEAEALVMAHTTVKKHVQIAGVNLIVKNAVVSVLIVVVVVDWLLNVEEKVLKVVEAEVAAPEALAVEAVAVKRLLPL